MENNVYNGNVERSWKLFQQYRNFHNIKETNSSKIMTFSDITRNIQESRQLELYNKELLTEILNNFATVQ